MEKTEKEASKIKNKKNSQVDFLYKRRNLLKSTRSQVTIFIIIALLIVAVVLFIFLIYPSIKITAVSKDPSSYLQYCAETSIKNNLQEIAEQGGSIKPENYLLYQGKKIDYLCYNQEYYKQCVMQKPFLKQSFETELKNKIESEIKNCLNSMKTDFEKKGYSVGISSGNIDVSIIPEKIIVMINYPVTISKESTSNYKGFKTAVKSQMYDLIMISSSILNWEARYGDSETTIYMTYYPNIKVEKLRQGDDSKVYILTERETQEKFQFATRSVAWPAGYGFGS